MERKDRGEEEDDASNNTSDDVSIGDSNFKTPFGWRKCGSLDMG